MSTAVKPKVGSIYISKVDQDSDLMWIHIAGLDSDSDYVSGAQFCFDRKTGGFNGAYANATIDPAEHILVWEPAE